MAEVAVFASGSGSNFEAITRFLEATRHRVCCLICDKKTAFVIERAEKLSIPAHVIPGWGKNRQDAERKTIDILNTYRPDLIVLAGFMRILTPLFLDEWRDRVVNIHPSLLPKYPGTSGIEESYHSGDPVMGITIHLVDYGTDTGPILLQREVERKRTDSLETMEEKIHRLEHYWYPRVIEGLLDSLGESETVD